MYYQNWKAAKQRRSVTDLFELRRNGHGILVHDAAVYADDPSRDDRLRAELFQKAAQGYQCDVRLPDDDVHEESGNMEAGPPCLRAVLVHLRPDPAAAVGAPDAVCDKSQYRNDWNDRHDRRVCSARSHALRDHPDRARPAEEF